MHDIKEITSLSIVGAGNVGWHLSVAFHLAGVQIRHIISRDPGKAEKLARQVDARALPLDGEIKDHPDLYIISVSDDAIPAVAERLSRNPAIITHTAGSTGIDVLKSHSKNCGVLYPLQTFTSGVEMDYQSIPFLVEGANPSITGLLKDLASKVSNTVREVDSASRLEVHLAAVFACNFTMHMTAVADEMLASRGMKLSMLQPLINQTWEKLTTMEPRLAQTGPARRGDETTMKKHLKALGEREAEQEIYRLISANIARYEGHNT